MAKEDILKLEKGLEKALENNGFIQIYQCIRAKHRGLKDYATPDQLKDFLQDINKTDYDKKDALLKILLQEYQTAISPKMLGTFLIHLLIPGIHKIYYQLLATFPLIEKEELLNQIGMNLLEVLKEFDLDRYGQKIAGVILGKSFNKVRSWYFSEKRYGEIKNRGKQHHPEVMAPRNNPKANPKTELDPMDF